VSVISTPESSKPTVEPTATPDSSEPTAVLATATAVPQATADGSNSSGDSKGQR